MDILADRVEQIICHKCGGSVSTAGHDPFTAVSCPGCETKLSVPAKLGNLLLLKPVGRGGMGVVYRAMDTTLRRTVAVKILKKEENQEDRERIKMCLAEARSLAALNHPNVVHVFSIGMERGQPFIQMELLDAGRLDKMIKKDKPVDEVSSLRIILEVAEGLRAALGAGLVHGDVKPANVLMNQENVAKLIDFGIARHVDAKDEDLPQFVGTPYFVAPEIVRGGKLDHRSDIFSLGVTLFVALTSKRPFTGDTVKAVLRSRLDATAQNVRELVPTLHPETGEVVARMLTEFPDDRYQTYEELIADLAAALEVAKTGPVDPALADLGAALQQASTADPGGADRSSRSSTAAKSRTVRGSTAQREEKQPVSGMMIGAIVGGVVLLAVIVLVIALTGGGGGTGGSESREFIDQFDGEKLDRSWSRSGTGGELNGAGAYTLSSDGLNFDSSLERKIGEGDFECQFQFDNINWNSNVAARIWILIENPDSNNLDIRIEKSHTAAPVLRVSNIISGGASDPVEVQLSAPSQLNLKILWEESTGRFWIYYGTSGDATTLVGEPIITTYKSHKRRTCAVGVTGIRGEGFFTVDLARFVFKPLATPSK